MAFPRSSHGVYGVFTACCLSYSVPVAFAMRCHGVHGVCKALSWRSWRLRGASTASYGVFMIKALKKMNKRYANETLFLFCLLAVRAVLERRGSAVRTPWKRGANAKSAAQTQ